MSRPEPSPVRPAPFLTPSTALFNSALQAAYFLVGVRAAGHRSILVMNIGVPDRDASFPRLPRLTADDVITWL
ncbi:hypothetical protein [Streptomyces flavidovirens]|uniref:hypothetical protein n=1 Tax=Streptomyces flavidovirens TaxID=67298 RepID=UPI00367E3AB7